MKVDTGKIRESEKLDWEKLESQLRSFMELPDSEMAVAQFHGGHANLSYEICFGDRCYVLRRPPFGKIAPGAHDMKREYKVLSKLNEYYPMAPKAYYFCDDESIIGAPFVIMERRYGIVVRYKVPEVFEGMKDVEQRLTDALIDAHAALHQVDYKKAELEDLGRVEGFLERQIRGWMKRWQLLTGMTNDRLSSVFKALLETIPDSDHFSIIHNDFKFDNCQFEHGQPDKVSSVFDWDMSTLGDPLFDFASSLAYWPDEKLQGYNLPIMLHGNFPDKNYLKERYFDITGFDASSFKWYECLAYAKTTVIASQLFKRFKKGDSQDQRMQKFEAITEVFIYQSESYMKDI